MSRAGWQQEAGRLSTTWHSASAAPTVNTPPDEKRLADACYAAYYDVWLPIQKSLSQDRPRLFKPEGYTVDGDPLGDALERLCSPAFRAEYARVKGETRARQEAREKACRHRDSTA